MQSRTLRFGILVVVTLTGALSAQTVWNVTPEDDLQAILDQASPGDIVELEPGSYERFRLDKGLTILGSGATFGNSFATEPIPEELIFDIPPGQTALIRGIDHATDFFVSFPPSGIDLRGWVEIRGGGTVVFEDCILRGPIVSNRDGQSRRPAVCITGTNVVFVGSRARGRRALFASNSNISIVQGRIEGGDLGNHVMECVGTGSLRISSSSVIGEDWDASVAPTIHAPTALRTEVRTTIDQCVIQAGREQSGTAGRTGAPGLVCTNLCRMARTLPTGGDAAIRGPGVVGVVTQTPSLLSARRIDSAPAQGQDYRLVFTTEAIAGTPIAICVSLAPPGTPLQMPGLVDSPWWLRGCAETYPATTSADGTFWFEYPVPSDPLLARSYLSIQGARLTDTGIETSPVVASFLP